jgi:glycosyltransferase involved in cell wall biosynthesis
MRLLMIGSVFPRFPGDDQVPWLRRACVELKRAGVEVEALIPAHRGLKSHVLDGIPVHRFRYAPASLETLTGEEGAPSKLKRNPLLKLLAVAYLWSGFWALVGLLMKKRYDVVEVHWPFPHAYMALPAVWAGARVVYHYHSAELKQAGAGAVSRWAFKLSLSWAKAHIVNSSYTGRILCKFSAKMTPVVVPYGSPIEFQTAERPSRPCRKILFVGRHIERKGVPYLIEAMKLLPSEYTLTIVGAGDATESWKALAVGQARICFAGKLSAEALAEAYQSHDIFALPAILDSRGDTEGLGVVLVEAVAAGLPIVASNVGGIPDVVEDGVTGLLVPEKDPQALARALQKLGQDAALAGKLVAGARAKVAREFTWDAVTRKELAALRGA